MVRVLIVVSVVLLILVILGLVYLVVSNTSTGSGSGSGSTVTGSGSGTGSTSTGSGTGNSTGTGSGTGSNSGSGSATSSGVDITVAPQLQLLSSTPTTLTVTWSAIPSFTYNVYYLINGSVKSFLNIGPTGTYTITNLTASTTYQVSLRAVDSTGTQSPTSNIVPVTTPAPPPQQGCCFGAGTRIRMLDGSGVDVADIKAGDVTSSGATVICVVEAIGARIPVYKAFPSVYLTSNHPYRYTDSSTWVFPTGAPARWDTKVYNLVLNQDHWVEEENSIIKMVTLGTTELQLKNHSYYGTERGLANIKSMAEFSLGRVVIAGAWLPLRPLLER